MSRDIFVQDIPAGIADVKEIPHGWMPDPLPYSHGAIIAAIRRVVPSADFSDPEWGLIEGDDYSIEVNIAHADPMRSFAFHVRAAGRTADHLIADMLEELGLRAFDPDDESGIFRDPRTPAS